VNKIRESAKALVAAVAPLVSLFVTNVLADLSTRSSALIAALSAAVLTWLVPNKTAEPTEAP
jgi:hypothetical protein